MLDSARLRVLGPETVLRTVSTRLSGLRSPPALTALGRSLLPARAVVTTCGGLALQLSPSVQERLPRSAPARLPPSPWTARRRPHAQSASRVTRTGCVRRTAFGQTLTTRAAGRGPLSRTAGLRLGGVRFQIQSRFDTRGGVGAWQAAAPAEPRH